MSCNLNIVKNFRVSRTLFTKEDGSPILFYYAANPSDALKEIVEKGGGLMMAESELEQNLDHCIKLCDTRDDPEIKQGYLPLSYIKHCVMRNKILGEQFYRDTQLGQGQVSSPSKGERSDSDGHGKGSKLMVCPQIMGRKKYTLNEDLSIMRYLINHNAFSYVGGNKIWKRMESLKITDHSFQSMKYRYLKNILPGIHQYDIPATWISKLTKTYRTWTQEEEDEMEEDDLEELPWEDDETLEPESAESNCDESTIDMATEESHASTSDQGSMVSEGNEEATPNHNIDKSNQKPDETHVSTNLNTSGISEEDLSFESDSDMELFSVKTKNPAVSCKAKDPEFTGNSSLADNDDVDQWIFNKITGEKMSRSKSPLNSNDEIPADQRLQAAEVNVLQRRDLLRLCQEGGHVHPDDSASLVLTRNRIQAIMLHCNVNQSEAAYLMLQYPDKFWQLP